METGIVFLIVLLTPEALSTPCYDNSDTLTTKPRPTVPSTATWKRVQRRVQMIQNLFPEDWPFLGHCLRPEEPKGILNFDLRQCQTGESPPFSKSSRIAVVGAGPAGISITKLLSDRGFSDITIFEKENRVGGKSKQLVLASGEKVDVGTVWTAGKYECLELWAEEVGMTETPVNPRLVSSPETVLADMEAPNFGDVGTWYADYAFRTYNVNPAEFANQIVLDAQNYIQFWAQTMASPEYMFPSESTLDFTAINQSFLSWLEERQLFALIPRLHASTSGQGYGSLNKIPAYYGLMWNHPNLLGGTGRQSGLSSDWQTMWERLLEGTNAKVHLGSHISWIKRGPLMELPFGLSSILSFLMDLLHRWLPWLFAPVEITFTNGAGVRQRGTFDFVIMATPMPSGLDLLLKPTKTELELFSEYNYRSLVYNVGSLTDTGAVEPSEGTDGFDLFSWMDRAEKQSDYHVTRRRPSRFDATVERTSFVRDEEDGTITLGRPGKFKGLDSNTAVLMSIAPFDITTETSRELAVSDLNSYGMSMDIAHTEIWKDYFPWKNLTQIVADRMPWRIWDNQGNTNSWFIGSYASFESVADALDYNLQLVNEMLCE